jgi:hypothetical protein
MVADIKKKAEKKAPVVRKSIVKNTPEAKSTATVEMTPAKKGGGKGKVVPAKENAAPKTKPAPKAKKESKKALAAAAAAAIAESTAAGAASTATVAPAKAAPAVKKPTKAKAAAVAIAAAAGNKSVNADVVADQHIDPDQDAPHDDMTDGSSDDDEARHMETEEGGEEGEASGRKKPRYSKKTLHRQNMIKLNKKKGLCANHSESESCIRRYVAEEKENLFIDGEFRISLMAMGALKKIMELEQLRRIKDIGILYNNFPMLQATFVHRYMDMDDPKNVIHG